MNCDKTVRHEKPACEITGSRNTSSSSSTMSLAEVLILVFALIPFSLSQLHPNEPAQYRALPSLREQAIILDGWRDVRLARLPQLLQKYEMDAWLVSTTYTTLY